MSQQSAPPHPLRMVAFPNRELGIVWDDEHESYLPMRELRCACPCAKCVDEMTGKKVLRDETIAADISINAFQPVGNYAIGIDWSDGADTGIYTFEKLRSMCPSGK